MPLFMGLSHALVRAAYISYSRMQAGQWDAKAAAKSLSTFEIYNGTPDKPWSGPDNFVKGLERYVGGQNMPRIHAAIKVAERITNVEADREGKVTQADRDQLAFGIAMVYLAVARAAQRFPELEALRADFRDYTGEAVEQLKPDLRGPVFKV